MHCGFCTATFLCWCQQLFLQHRLDKDGKEKCVATPREGFKGKCTNSYTQEYCIEKNRWIYERLGKVNGCSLEL
ncbi:hypothetical protein Q7C36_005854 [Tachysurus vachellii]|uniref:Uncharacterized protein n=1 Tax=Tachysurus vachellii TaxID=175792 RepID=A0AA88SZM1_TACVA|nr:hypothetical protein Q7C36_005854 [Tachysurus vachellii]